MMITKKVRDWNLSTPIIFKSYSDIETLITFYEKIGEGRYGKVYKGILKDYIKDNHTGKIIENIGDFVAIKEIYLKSIDDRHVNIV